MSSENYFDKVKQSRAIEWLKDKWPATRQACEICDARSWIVAEDLVMPIQFAGGALKLGGPTYPQIMVICNNCGNTKYFNAVIAGLVTPIVDKEGKQNVR